MAKPVVRQRVAAQDRPVARVAVDVSLAHLDRPFDYLVPADLDEPAVPGCRVRVRFAGRLVDGFVLERRRTSEHDGQLAFLDKVVSAEPVLRPEVAALARAVADRYAGTLADVLRLAVPPRHARVENAPAAGAPAASAPTRRARRRRRGPHAVGERYPDGPRASSPRCARGAESPRAVLTVLPGEDWPARLAEAVAATVHSGRGAVVVVPDARDLDRLDAALTAALGRRRRHVALQRLARAGRAVPAVPAAPAAARCGSCRHPGGRLRPGARTSVWWRSGTTATTCTPSRARPTRTRCRCC